MQFVLGSLKSVEPSLVKLLKADLPVVVSYKLSKLYDIIVQEVNKMEELRKALVIRYGEEVDNQVKVKPECMRDFTNEYSELLAATLDVDFSPISIGYLLNYNDKLERMELPTINISAVDISNLRGIGILEE